MSLEFFLSLFRSHRLVVKEGEGVFLQKDVSCIQVYGIKYSNQINQAFCWFLNTKYKGIPAAITPNPINESFGLV